MLQIIDTSAAARSVLQRIAVQSLCLTFSLGLLLGACTGIDAGSREQLNLIPITVGSSPNRKFQKHPSGKDLDYAISNQDYARAAILLFHLENQEGLDDRLLQKYRKVIEEGFGDLFLETLDRKGVMASLSYYYSLQSMGIAERYLSISDFSDSLFNYYLTKQYFGAALNFAQTSLQNDIQLNATTRNMFQKFIRDQFSGNTVEQNSNFWARRIQGTVTIMVRMGNRRIPYTRLYLPLTEIGSGFFIDNSGSIITNYHVIASQAEKGKASGHIFVKLSTRDELIPARLVGWDPNRDLALLRISRPAPYLLTMNSNFNALRDNGGERSPQSALVVGNELFAIGAPGGLADSLTSGRISARGREILPLTEALQIDVPANPGNSGGPLLNSQGVVEGVVFAKNNSGYEGIAFAIPSDTLSSVLPRLYLGGKVKNSWLGLVVDEHSNSEEYLEIRYVFPGSPAAEVGLEPGMRILNYRNGRYTGIKSLQSQISNGPIGAIVNLSVSKAEDLDSGNGSVHEFYLELRERPDKPMYRNLNQDSSSELFYALFGTRLQTQYGKRRNSYEIASTLPYSQVSQLNLHEGDSLQILQWLMDAEKNVIIAHISYSYQDGLDQSRKQSVLIQQLDLPNIL